VVVILALADGSEHVEESRAGDERLEGDIHVAVDVGVGETFIYFIKVSH